MRFDNENLITFDSFNNRKAFEFGQRVVEKTENKVHVRIRVFLDGDIVFQYLENGKKKDEWLNRKQFLVMATGHSSLYVFDHQKDFSYLTNNPQIIHTGGGYPLYVGNELRGCFLVSGMKHTEDHQMIVDTLKEMQAQR